MEVWKDIYFWRDCVEYDFRGLYQVSNKGYVKSLNRIDSKGRKVEEKILKPKKNKKSYEYVVLSKDGKKKNFFIHRLVAYMFVDGYFEGACIDHIDTNKQNNCYTNLRWCTHKENSNNELTLKHLSEANKGKHPSEETRQKISKTNKEVHTGKPNGKASKLIDRYTLDGKYVDTKFNFEYVQMGFIQSGITKCCKGKRKKTGGYVFKYHEEVE